MGLRPGWMGLRPDWLAQRGGTDKRTDGKSPHSTVLCPLSGPLPKNDAFSVSCFPTVKVMSCTHKYPHQPHLSLSYQLIHIWEGYFPHLRPSGPPPKPQNSQTYPPKETHIPYHVFKCLKRCHASTNTTVSKLWCGLRGQWMGS